MDTETLLAVGGLVIGGAGAFATAVSAYLVGRRRAQVHNKKTDVEADKVEVEEKKVEVEEKKIEALERRIDLEHHEAIVNGYKDLIVQYQKARDLANDEVRTLSEKLTDLSNKFETLSKSHEKCEADGKAMQERYDAQQAIINNLQAELATLIAAYGHSGTSATPEVPTPDATTAA
jgi:uncharacterized coiled-coil protein SlyX